MTRFFNLLLIAATAVALVLLVDKRKELAEVRSEYKRLAADYGVLDVQDPSKYVVTRIDTGDPHHFLWRVYYPGNLRVEEYSGIGPGGSMGGSSMHSDSGEHLHRCRFEFEPRQISIHMLDRSGGGRMSLGDQRLTDFLSEHWDQLHFDALAESGPVSLATDKVLPLLIIRIPERLRDELVEQVGERKADRYLHEPLFESVYGTKTAMQAYRLATTSTRH